MHPNNFYVRFKKVGTFFLGVFILLSISTATFPQRAQAQFGFSLVTDPLDIGQNTINAIENTLTQVKGYVLDPLAWVLSKATLQSIVKSTINSINKTSNGSPAYATNIDTLLKSAGDTAANNFISQLQTNGSIKSPFQTAVATAVSNNYLQSTSNTGFFTQNAYTLNTVSPNPTTAMNGGIFTQQGGGFNAWMSAWTYSPNNPFSASLLAANGLGSQVADAQSVQQKELNFGQGYLSSRPPSTTSTTGGSTSKTSSGGTISLSGLATNLTSAIQTPGSTIKASLEKATGSGIDTLINTHTFNEILTSLLGQLVGQIVGGGGLSGVSQPSPTTGTSYFDQTDPSQATINSNLNTSFTSTISNQVTSVLSFQTNWTTINTAALAANTALSNSTCYPNAQATITGTVQPVLNQAAAALAQASNAITALQKIQGELPPANSTSAQTAAITQASTDYTNLLQGSTLPSASDISFAATQSIDNSASTTSPPTLYTQMKQLATAAQTCTAH